MSLYDDDDDAELKLSGAKAAMGSTGWSKGASWMQSAQKQSLAMAASGAAVKKTVEAARPQQQAFPKPVSLPPVINLQKSGGGGGAGGAKKSSASSSAEMDSAPKFIYGGDKLRGDKSLLPLTDPNWSVVNEYDPLWPNDYHKVVKEIREAKRHPDEDEPDSKRRRYTESSSSSSRDRDKGSSRHDNSPPSSSSSSGFGRRPRVDDYSDEEDDDRGRRRGNDSSSGRRRDRGSSSSSASGGGGGGSASGAAIAPPPSLTESSSSSVDKGGEQSNGGGMSMVQKLASMPATTNVGGGLAGLGGGLGVAAKIMAKYGYKQGQGLGAQEQGMSSALSVEKTSKRGGRIVHEKDLMPPPPFAVPAPPGASSSREGAETPPMLPPGGGDYGDAGGEEGASSQGQQKPSITDLMRNPSKVVLCKNMVGPGEVDDDLEPEVKEECNGKYGDVNKVVIFELKNVAEEEAVRIFIEFKRVESAIKAVVDLNGRFFGGREVAASFYNFDKFNNLQLTD